MKASRSLIIAALIAAFLCSAGLSFALEPIPQESGFSGFIRPGVGYLWFKSNMVASFLGYDLSDKKTNSLDDNPDSQSNGIGLAPFLLQYTFAGPRTQLFLGTELTDFARFDYNQQLGVKQGIGSFGILQGGLLYSSIPAKVWKDPYVVDQNRNETSRESTGVRLVWDRIFGSGFQLQYTYQNIDISSEKSGKYLVSQGLLTSQERGRLKRDGDQQTGEILYRFNFDKKHQLAPAFAYSYDDRDGGAMRNDVYNFKLTYAYFGDPFTFTANGLIGWADYDKKNPIYGKTENDDNYGLQGSLFYKNPWGWTLFGSKPMNFYVASAYTKIDANIDFYDQEAFLATAGVFFRW
jgi:hypothetical protein